MRIWQQDGWPSFTFNFQYIEAKLLHIIELQKKLLGEANSLPTGLDKSVELDALLQSVIKTSEIEGEKLNVESVRSSVAKHLNVERLGLAEVGKRENAVVEMLSAAITDIEKPITEKILFQWQSLLFVEPTLFNKIKIGEFRDDALGPMQVVSTRHKGSVLHNTQQNIKVHYQAPPANSLSKEIKLFLEFYNQAAPYHGILKAAVAHLYFISLHPFDDGNGRIARALTDRSLAQAENTSVRFYSLSSAIEKNKESYYQILEETQNCRTQSQEDNPIDITQWVVWFLDVLAQAIDEGLNAIKRVLQKANFWQYHAQTILSERQVKVLNRLLDNYGNEFTEGIAARHYKSIGKVSKATATRDLIDLQNKGCLKAVAAGGRSARYVIQL